MKDKKHLEIRAHIQKIAKSKMIFIIGLLILSLLSGCLSQPNDKDSSDEKIKVSVTFYPLYEIAKNVGGENANVASVVPINIEPHDYEPTPKQLVQIDQSQIIILLGVGFENLENKITSNVNSQTIIVKASQGIVIVTADHNADGKDQIDPHIWLSPKRMVLMTTNIKNAFMKADPAHAQEYEKNAQDYIKRLNELDDEYTNGLSNCSKDAILTSHAAFGYLAGDYGFRQIAISGLSPDSEPNPQKLAELIETAKRENISYIFYEDLVDPKISQTIANEAGANTLPLSPIEGTKNSNDDYFSIMERNLEKIKLARGCS